MFRYKRLTAIEFFLRLLEYAIQNDTHPGRGIKAAAARIDRAVKSGSDDSAEAVIDTETEIVEGLLGAAYVVCQTQITAIAQAALQCCARTVKDGLAFTAFAESSIDLTDAAAKGRPFSLRKPWVASSV